MPGFEDGASCDADSLDALPSELPPEDALPDSDSAPDEPSEPPDDSPPAPLTVSLDSAGVSDCGSSRAGCDGFGSSGFGAAELGASDAGRDGVGCSEAEWPPDDGVSSAHNRKSDA